MKFFSLDSGFHKYGTIVFDMIALNIFWVFTSLATLGLLMPLGNAALFHSIYHVVIEEEGYMTKTYFSILKKKFFKSLALTLISMLLFGLSLFNLWTIYSGMIKVVYLLPLYFMILFEVTITMLFAYALLGETDMTVKQLMKYGFLLSNKHLLTSILSVLIIVAMVTAIIFINPILLLAVVSVGFWLMAILIHKRCFTKYYLEKLI